MKCAVYIFPLEKRIGRVRRVAEVLHRMNRKEGNGYWRTRVRFLHRDLARLGCTEDEIDTELTAFRDAVSAELNRLWYKGKSHHTPDGAA